jgi:hypothetical protein
MLRLIVTALTVTLLGGVAMADRDRGRGDHDRRDHRPNARDHRNDGHRVNRPAQRANRRVLHRQPVRAQNGRYVFAGGVHRTYQRPVIRSRYYNVRARPQLIVESYDPVPGYIWVRGSWAWSGREWRWNDGYFASDPQYATYYDDGSYDYSVNVHIGG